MDQLQEIVPLKLKVQTLFGPLRATSPVRDAIRGIVLCNQKSTGLRIFQGEREIGSGKVRYAIELVQLRKLMTHGLLLNDL
jgi:hypothetical protein